MYRRLPHGPHGMGREDSGPQSAGSAVRSDDRGDLEQGYKATTVAQLIALAGVSRRAFYEQFANKEECFLATYDIAVARARKRSSRRGRSERGWANRVHRAFKAILEDAIEITEGPASGADRRLGLGVDQTREHMLAARSTVNERCAREASGPRPTACRCRRWPQGDRRRHAPCPVRAPARPDASGAAHARPTNCSTGSAPIARRRRGAERAGAAAAHAAPSRHVPRERREARARARSVVQLTRTRGTRNDRPADRAVRRHVHRVLPQAVPLQAASASSRFSKPSGRNEGA